jgi:hypothetical protein
MMVEECFQWDFCEETAPYIEAGKDVLAVEYFEADMNWDKVCADAGKMGLHMLIKDKEVTAGGRICE